MSELSELIAARDDVLARIKRIGEPSEEDVTKILDAIGKQRWFFLKNYPMVLMDGRTGILWANLDYFPYEDGEIGNFDEESGIRGWGFPMRDEMTFMIDDKTFPFHEGLGHRIKGKDYWRIDRGRIDLDNFGTSSNTYGCLIPCNRSLVPQDYAKNVDPDNHAYNLLERLCFTLSLFLNNGLWPIFNDDSITQLFGRLYIEKPELTKRLDELQTRISELKIVRIPSSEFDYVRMLACYDIGAIDSSIIKYFQALQSWTNGLMSIIEQCEREKDEVIRQYNMLTLKLMKRVKDSPKLNKEEHNLLLTRQIFFANKLSLGMNTTKSKILSFKKQADEIENRLDFIDTQNDSLVMLAKLEHEERASFSLVAEETARIIRNALTRIEYFEANKDFVTAAIDILTRWTESYKVFKTSLESEFGHSCEDGGIERKIWEGWFSDWQVLRFAIEKKLQPMLERGLMGELPVLEEGNATAVEEALSVLEEYRNSIDRFFLDERKKIYQAYAFKPEGELQDKLETESRLYGCTLKFQSDLQRVIFNCERSEDRIFILKWASSLLDIQIDEILSFVADKELQNISAEILDGLAKLKQRNYEAYLNDAKAYSDEKARRETEYNELVFRMRTGQNAIR